MKLLIQIPCYNEEKTLSTVLKELPKKLDGIDIIETQIIDDGSTDDTVKIAKNFGVNHIIRHKKNKGLGEAFKSGMENALKQGADILVNTDGDNQYPAKYIKDLIKPILTEEADIVMGDRQTKTVEHFSLFKKFFQWLGSLIVRILAGIDVVDSVSGFRAYSRETLYKLNITSHFSYAVDSLVQAGAKGLKIESVKIEINKPTRKSRLFKSMWHHISKTAQVLLRVYAMYNPLKIFFSLGSVFFILGSIGITRFLYFYFLDPVDTGRIQSLVLSIAFIIVAFQFFALGIIGDLIAKNRKLTEDNLYFSKKNYYRRRK